MSGWRVLVVCGTIAAFIAAVQFFTGPAVSLAQPLHDLPFEMGVWSGRVVPADPVLLQRAQPDTVVHRLYTGTRGRPILLYVGYYGRQASRGQTLAICSDDCTLVDRTVATIVVMDRPIQINKARVIVDRMPMLVAYWFQRGNTVIAEPYRNKLEQIRTGLLSRRSHGAVVRISTPIAGDEMGAWTDLLNFARAMQPYLVRLLPE